MARRALQVQSPPQLKYQKNGHRQRIAWQVPEIRRLVTWHIAQNLPTQRRTNNDCYDKWRNLLAEFCNNHDAIKAKYMVAHDDDFDKPDEDSSSSSASPTTILSFSDEEEEDNNDDAWWRSLLQREKIGKDGSDW
ncbi:hypothetical protein QOT17_016343 [Balamuthia mandrillaris]